jgi:hypothetical protein
VKVWSLGLVSKHWNTIYIQFCYMFAGSGIYFRLHLLLIIIHITCISLSVRRASAPIYLTSVLGVLGTQETSCIVIAGLLERDTFDLFLPEFDKPWVIHLRKTCCCSINLCTWRPNTIYKNRSVRRHHRACQSSPCRPRSMALPELVVPSPARAAPELARAHHGQSSSHRPHDHPWRSSSPPGAPGLAGSGGVEPSLELATAITREKEEKERTKK